MKKLIISLLVLGSSMAFAGSHSSMSNKWICTTNASSSDVAADKTADDHMTKNQGSAHHSFAFAEKHCRDCTKITCEAK